MKTHGSAPRHYPLHEEESAAFSTSTGQKHQMVLETGNVYWTSNMERVALVRRGLPFQAIESLSDALARPIKSILSLLNIPQTTYNKKKNEQALLDARHSELLLLMQELVDYGLAVFNQEADKFHRWLQKPNASLGGHKPESLLDTVTGMEAVRQCLQPIDYGNFS